MKGVNSMNFTDKSIWQVAAGDGSRDYADIFLKFGVILVGPGSEGNYFDNKETYINQQHWAYRPFIPTIAEQMKQGDFVVLKKPQSNEWEIIAIGEVVSDYIHTETFGDVDGWDLQHCRRIKWKIPEEKTIISGLRRGTLVAINRQDPIVEAQKIWNHGKEIIPEGIPETTEEITVDELIDSIMEQGLPVTSLELIANTIWKLRRIAKWYSWHGSDVGKHEIRTFLIVPLFTSLGWGEQKIKIEWNNIDVSIFDLPYSQKAKPVLLIESKRLWDGLLYAPKQAEQYAKQLPACKIFIVSDGIRYKLYERENNGWKYSAYMNLMSPKKRHPYYKEVKGAVEFFMKIMPSTAI